MQEKENLSEIGIGKQHIVDNEQLSIWEALVPVVILVGLLAYNIFLRDGVWLGEYSNHIILLVGSAVAAGVGFFNKVPLRVMIAEIWENLKSVFMPIMILLLVGALAGTWLVSGVIPAMVYYGLQVLSPSIFLPASVVIAAIISIAAGSSWTTSATVGIALVGIGTALGIGPGMIAGAVISGAYFGDKMSPLSDTTNLAPAMAGTDLFTHIRYMALTTLPTIFVTLIVFGVLGFGVKPSGDADVGFILKTIDATFYITPYLFIVPAVVVVLILLKTKPLAALGSGVVLAAVFAVAFQPAVLQKIAPSKVRSLAKAVFVNTSVSVANDEQMAKFTDEELQSISEHKTLSGLFTDAAVEEAYTDEQLAAIFKGVQSGGNIENKVGELQKLITLKKVKSLFSSKGMVGMLWTILLIVCAMVFGGIMDAIGALARITKELLKMATTVFGLFASTVVSCLGLNAIASDQYLAIVIPGKMFKKAYDDRNLAPENLSRTLEDSGTVTSVLIPWNTCGAYQSSVLGVGVAEYFFYAVFNWLSPFTTLLYAAFKIKIKMLRDKKIS
ncbi:MAG: Na+/H+ antiporter NhaC family protein [Marinirhabdus sp.]